MTPAVLLWTHREEEGRVLCGEGRSGNLWGLLSRCLCPVLLARNTSNLLDLQEGDKQKALVSILEVPLREGGGFCCTFSLCPCVPFLNPLQHPFGVTCQELGRAWGGGDRDLPPMGKVTAWPCGQGCHHPGEGVWGWHELGSPSRGEGCCAEGISCGQEEAQAASPPGPVPSSPRDTGRGLQHHFKWLFSPHTHFTPLSNKST